jgi:hypothetical protein
MPMVVKGRRRFVGETSLVFQFHKCFEIMTRKEVGAADDSLKKVMVSGSPKSHQDDSVY